MFRRKAFISVALSIANYCSVGAFHASSASSRTGTISRRFSGYAFASMMSSMTAPSQSAGEQKKDDPVPITVLSVRNYSVFSYWLSRRLFFPKFAFNSTILEHRVKKSSRDSVCLG